MYVKSRADLHSTLKKILIIVSSILSGAFSQQIMCEVRLLILALQRYK